MKSSSSSSSSISTHEEIKYQLPPIAPPSPLLFLPNHHNTTASSSRNSSRRPSTAPTPSSPATSTSAPAMDLTEQHTCFFTPLSILVAAQPVRGSTLASTALYLGPAHPRNTVLTTDLRNSASLPRDAIYRGPAFTLQLYHHAQPLPAVDFETLAALQGLLEAIRFVREKYARSSVCVHLRIDTEIAVKAWNHWIPRWEGSPTAAAGGSSRTGPGDSSGSGSTSTSTSTSRGWPQLPGRTDDRLPSQQEAAEAASARGLVSSSSPSSEDVTETASMFTALSTYSLRRSDDLDSEAACARSIAAPLDIEPPAPHVKTPPAAAMSRTSLFPAPLPPPSEPLPPLPTSNDDRRHADLPAPPPPTAPARIPREISASTYSAAYTLLRALAVLHRFFAHDNEEAFTAEHKWNGRMRLTVSHMPPGRISAATELLEQASRANAAPTSSNSTSPNASRRNSSFHAPSSQQQPTFTVTTVSWKRTLSEAERQEEEERQRALAQRKLSVQREIEQKQKQQQQRQALSHSNGSGSGGGSGRLHSVPSLFWKRRPSGHLTDTVDAVFERSQFATEETQSQQQQSSAGEPVSLVRRGSRAKGLFARRVSLTSAALLASAGSSGAPSSTKVPISTPSTPLLTPPSTNPTSPNVPTGITATMQRTPITTPKVSAAAAAAAAAASSSKELSPAMSDNDTGASGRFICPPSPGNALGGGVPVKRKPVPDLLPAPTFDNDGPAAVASGSSGPSGTTTAGGARRPSALGLSLDLPSASLGWAGFSQNTLAQPARQQQQVSTAALPSPPLLEQYGVNLKRSASGSAFVESGLSSAPAAARHPDATAAEAGRDSNDSQARTVSSPHRRTISVNVEELLGAERETSPRKRASTVTNTTLNPGAPAGAPIAAPAQEGDIPPNGGRNSIVFPNTDFPQERAAEGSGSGSGPSMPKWRWADPKQSLSQGPGHFQGARMLPVPGAAGEAENNSSGGSGSNKVAAVWPAWKWANPPLAAGYLSTAATPGHRSLTNLLDLQQQQQQQQDGIGAGSGAGAGRMAHQHAQQYQYILGSQPVSAGLSPANTRPPSIHETTANATTTTAHHTRWSESRAASPEMVIQRQREQLQQQRILTRESSMVSLASNVGGGGTGTGPNSSAAASAVHLAAPPSTGSSGGHGANGASGAGGRSGLTGSWKWSNESQSRLERQKARAEEMAAHTTATASSSPAMRLTGGSGSGTHTRRSSSEQHFLNATAPSGGGGGSGQPSMGSRRSSASGHQPASSLFSSSPYGSVGGGPGTLTALTLSAAGSSAAPSPGKPPAMTLHEAMGLQTGSAGSRPSLTLARRQRSIPKLSDVPDAEHSVVEFLLNHGEAPTEDARHAPVPAEAEAEAEAAAAAAAAAAGVAQQAQPEPEREHEPLVDEHGSPLSASDLALSMERQLATAAWTASIAPLALPPQQDHPHLMASSAPSSAPFTPASFSASASAATRGQHGRLGVSGNEAAVAAAARGVARAGTRSRILSSLKHPSIPSAEGSTARGSKLAVRTG
ncbi:hypothetical protein OC844_001514 [Tilletia horrida]|nr:hypothetical protein OC844_001514 [Tilletia horrida]